MLRSIEELKVSLLGSIGKKVRNTTKIETYVEVVFKQKKKSDQKNQARPDGLIVLGTGDRQ